MTALQGWFNNSLIDLDAVKTALADAWRAVVGDDADRADEPQLMGRGLERC
ncbi:hypothetical protein [Mycolicibacterium sp.]|uniref:hypothetical protein n=1 Tax=Mycolicibacterium sp. TaxID=2320850 RepID=UPI003D13D41B